MNKRNIYLGIILLFILSGSLFYLIDKDETTVYTESDRAFIEAAFSKVQLDDDISKSRRNIITETVKMVSPAIVGINVIEIRQYRDPFGSFFDDPFFRQFLATGVIIIRKLKD
jgi:serine protease Do